MLLSPPSDSEQAAIRAAHALRHPQSVRVSLVGDAGEPVTAHLIIGNPSGCRLAPNGPAPAGDPWRNFLATAIRKVPEPQAFRADLCADVVLWPTPPDWYAIAARWPGLPTQLVGAVLRKVGAVESTTRHLGGFEYEYAPTKADRFRFQIKPPDAMAWQLFVEGLRDERGDLWRTLSETVAASVEMPASGGSLASVVDRWPGFVLRAFDLIQVVAGAAAEVELGE